MASNMCSDMRQFFPGAGSNCLHVLFPVLLCVQMVFCFSPLAAEAENLTIAVGRDFYDGSDSRSFLHGSTNTWEGLTWLDKNLHAVPWLAQSWQSADEGRQWTFFIRKDVLFHDGTRMSNADVAAAVQRIIAYPRYDPTGCYQSVISVRAQGTEEVVFQLKEPVPYFPKLTAYYSSPVIKPSCIDAQGRITNLIGTGPYKVSRILPGDRIELTAFDRYWGGKALYEKVVFRTVTDAHSRLLSLMAGETDAVADVGAILPEQAGEIRRHPDLILKQVQVATTHLLIFNSRIPPFSQAENRVWFAGLLDRDGLIAAFAKDAGIPAYDPYVPFSKDFAFGLIRPEPKPFPRCFSEKQIIILLNQATLQRWPYAEMAQVMQEMLRSHGIAAKIETRETGAWQEALKSGRFHMAVQPYTLMTGDPDFFYAYWIASDAPGNCGWKDAQTDRLVRNARHEMDAGKRKELYRQLAEKIRDQLPLLPLYHDVSLYACRKQAGEFEMDHLFRPCLTEKMP
ncbi:MAG: ABC transporter substrate-binding protein [Desulfobacterales bacterium]